MMFLKKLPLAVVAIIFLSCSKFSGSTPPEEDYISCDHPDMEFRHPDCENTWAKNKYYIECKPHDGDDCKVCDCGRHVNLEDFGVKHYC